MIMGYTPGKAGPPSFIFVNGCSEPFSVPPDAPPSALSCLKSGTYRGVFFDSAQKRIGKSFPIAINHVGEEPEGAANDAPGAVSPGVQEQLNGYKELVDKLTVLVDKLVTHTVETSKEALRTQVEVTKVAPKVLEASAQLLKASKDSSDFAHAAKQVQEVWESAPEPDASQLETVLNSPVVIGAAAALQKYMAKAAENGAEAMVANDKPRRENMAERAARLAAAANDRARREAAARS